jgi:hypothetical protein
MKLQKPWPDGYSINKNSPYGWRIHPITGKKKFHQGVDVAGSFPVHSAGDGIIDHVGWSPSGGGHTVRIKHASDLYTVYYHGAHATEWEKGQRINKGDFIYQSGTTGASTGNHLHFEVRKSSRWGDTMDPEPYLSGSPVVSQPAVVPVSGRMDKKTWKSLQMALKASGDYRGIIDGIPGRMTYEALQRWSGAPVDGIMGPQTRRAVQSKLGVKADGIWGKMTISELQRKLNAGKI